MDRLDLCLGFFELADCERVVWAARPPKSFFRHDGWAEWYQINRAGRLVTFYKGSQLGHLSVKVRVNGVNYTLQAHRIVWALTHKTYPDCDIDHLNNDPTDNRLANLRLATRGQNRENALRRKDGLKGAYQNKGDRRWFSMVWDGARLQNLGTFDTPEAAHDAWARAKADIAGGFFNPGYASVFD